MFMFKNTLNILLIDLNRQLFYNEYSVTCLTRTERYRMLEIQAEFMKNLLEEMLADIITFTLY